MEKWIDVITNPLGLAGFAVFLVFTALSQAGGKNRPFWLMPTFVAMALISLLGGLWLASSSQTDSTATNRNGTATAAPGGTSSVTQITSGHGSPTVTGVTGNVTITVTDRDDEQGERH